MKWENTQQQAVRTQPIKTAAIQPPPKKHRMLIGLIKLIILIGFLVGAYYVLKNLGIIEKVKQGLFLLKSI